MRINSGIPRIAGFLAWSGVAWFLWKVFIDNQVVLP